MNISVGKEIGKWLENMLEYQYKYEKVNNYHNVSNITIFVPELPQLKYL